MNNQNDESHASIPIKRVHESYQNSLEARRRFVQVRPGGPAARSAARHNLHTAVGDYYETLRSIVRSSGRGTDFWTGTEEHHLWTDEVYVVETDQGVIPVHRFPEEDLTEELLSQAYVQPEYVGLEELENEWAKVSTEEHSFTDATGSHTSQVESADPLPVDVLFRTARLLDELAGELGFLADPGTVVETDPTPV